MNTYIFKTAATMKPYNNKRWYISSDIIQEKEIKAETVLAALEEYQHIVEGNDYISISANAIKNRSPMFIDTSNGPKQVGYVITGKTEFEDRDNYRWSTQYIDLWVTIITVIDTDFPEEMG